MQPLHPPSMLARFLALAFCAFLALAPAATAAGVETPSHCNGVGCVQTADTDEDGDIDWASVSTGTEFHATNVVWRGENETWWAAEVNTDDHEETHYVVGTTGHAHYAGHQHADGYVEVVESTPMDGEENYVFWFFYGVEPPHRLPIPHDHEHAPHLP